MRNGLYRQLLRMYPRAYRERFGTEMAEVVAQMLEDAPGTSGRLRVWFVIVQEMPGSLAAQYTYEAATAWRQTMPGYVKRDGIIAGLLLAPFAAALTANAISVGMTGQNLYHSWLWKAPFIQLWAAWLPQISVMVAFAGWLVYIMRGSGHGRLGRAFDVWRAWPVMFAGLAAGAIILALLFHDSVHCFVRNPAFIVTHVHQVLQCSQKGMLGG